MYTARKIPAINAKFGPSFRFVHSPSAKNAPVAATTETRASIPFLPPQRWPPMMSSRFPSVHYPLPPCSLSIKPEASPKSAKINKNAPSSVSSLYESTSTLLKRITTKLRNKQVRQSINELVRRKKKSVQDK
ncbi:phosphatidylinositol-4-phosphate 5-kinase-like protein [Perkinsela sp. CCAP 1560/4]|nr:phosphatidylinositol-4-phosphate 5-kinase-like protein [Perkinsela sp. CCAP 1560/4]|eukprot:KNH04209.1 phosphatidylinositol-4-phosphate 5-kinase-like protein [Perkinsela sp. CCAP 1560/4]